MVASPVVLGIGAIEFLTGQFFAYLDGFQHRAMAETTAADIVNFPAARCFVKVIKRLNQIVAVNVVTDLLALVAEHGVRRTCHGAFHQVGKKTVKLSPAVVWPG